MPGQRYRRRSRRTAARDSCRLLELAESVPEKKDAHPGKGRRSLLERIGSISIGYGQSTASSWPSWAS